MAARKQKTQAQTLAEIAPFIKVCLIQRLSNEDSRGLLEKQGYEMSDRTYSTYKKLYNTGTTKRFLDIAKSEWANEHVLTIDVFKEIEAKYWEIFNNTEEENTALKALDSLRALQEQKTLYYNETPLIQKMKETIEAKLEALQKK